MNRFVAEEDGQPFYWNDLQDAEDDIQPMPEEGAGPSAADTAARQRQTRAGGENREDRMDGYGQPPHTRVTPGGRDMEGGRPMSEGREDKLKAMLYPYLEQRMATRAKTYGAAGTEARMAEANGLEEEGRRLALLSGLSEDGAKFGSLHGKIPETSVPGWAQNTMAAAKLGASARAGVRAEDEKSLGTDLDIGKTIADSEMDEKKRKDAVTESDLKRQFLYDELEAKKKGGRLGVAGRASWAPTDYDDNGQPIIIDRSTGDTKTLPGAKRYVKPSTTSTDPSWQAVRGARGPNGEVVVRNPKTNKSEYVPLPPGAVRDKPKSAQPKALTGEEKNAAMFYKNANAALGILESMEAKGFRPDLKTAAKLTLTPRELEGHVFTPDEQRYIQAARDYTAAKLRLESGAAISPKEVDDQMAIYMSKAGEDEGTLRQKQASRRSALDGLRFKAGRGADEIMKQSPSDGAELHDMSDAELDAELNRLKGGK